MKLNLCLGLGLFISNLAFASSNQSSCLPVLGEAVAAVQELNQQINDANRNVEQIMKRYDAALNSTIPHILEQAEDITDLVRSRLSLGYLIGVPAASTAITLAIGIGMVASWRALRNRFCPVVLSHGSHCQMPERGLL